MSLKYQTGEEIQKGDRALFHRQPGEIEFVGDSPSAIPRRLVLSRAWPRRDAAGHSFSFLRRAGRWFSVGTEMRFIDAYLEPDVSNTTIRRGRVVHLESAIVNGTAVWRVRSGASEYAQVLRGSNHRRGSLDGRSIERPFIVEGQFSDQELISLVSFVRRSPKRERKVDPGVAD